MGKKIVCDRCGANIKEPDPRSNTIFPLITANILIAYSISMCDIKEYDLCDKCKSDLIEWIRKGKEASE